MDECEVGTLRSLGEGGCASGGSALRSVWRGATAVRPWGSTFQTRDLIHRAREELAGRPAEHVGSAVLIDSVTVPWPPLESCRR